MKFEYITPTLNKSSHSFFKSIVENMNEGVFVVDEDYKFIYSNSSFSKMLQTQNNPINGASIKSFITEGDMDNFDIKLSMIKKGIDEKFDVNFNVQSHNRLFSISPKAEFNDKNEFTGFFGIVKDITEDRIVHSSLSISDDILEEIGTLFIVGNTFGEILYCAPSVKNILGYEPGEMLKNGWFNKTFLNSSQILEAKKRYQDTSITPKGEELEHFYEREVLCENGDKKWILWQDTPGPVGLFISVGHDITERKNTELKLINSKQALKQKNNELDTFVYKASHDLKGPLASIIGLTNIALAQNSSKEEQEEIFKMIQTSTNRLNNILDDLLRISRATHGTVNYTILNIHSIIKDVIDSLKHSDLAKDIVFEVYGDQELVFNTDKDFISSIFQNIISNAVKYSDNLKKNKLVTVKFNLEDENLNISISDNGVGIPQNKQEKVFDMFYRANNTNIEGTGLGLYIVKSTLKKIDGNINIISKEQEGTSFIIKLPKK